MLDRGRPGPANPPLQILETKGESYRLQDAKRRRKGDSPFSCMFAASQTLTIPDPTEFLT